MSVDNGPTGGTPPSATTVPLTIRRFTDDDRAAVIDLWRRCDLTRPRNDPDRDIDRKLTVQPELFLVGEDDSGAVVASVMAGYDGHRGWMNYLAVDPGARGRGHARALIERVEAELLERGCPKVNLQVRSSNAAVLDLYRRLGYTVDDVVSMGRRLVED